MNNNAKNKTKQIDAKKKKQQTKKKQKKRYRQTAVHNFVLPTACYDDQTAVFSSAPNLLLYLQAKNKI